MADEQEQEMVDPLDQLMDDIESVALDVRESRAMSNQELQRSYGTDFFPILYAVVEEVLSRDLNHEARLRRLETALGYGELEEEEIDAWLAQEPPSSAMSPAAVAQVLVLAKAVADEVGALDGASAELRERAALLSAASEEGLREAVEAQEEPEEDEDEEEEGDDEAAEPEEAAPSVIIEGQHFSPARTEEESDDEKEE